MLEKMKEIIAEQLNADADSITEASSFKDDLGADSLDLFELVMALEDEYSVEIPAEDLQNLLTVGEVINSGRYGLGGGTSSGGGSFRGRRIGTDRRGQCSW